MNLFQYRTPFQEHYQLSNVQHAQSRAYRTEYRTNKEQRLEKAIVYVHEQGFITNSLYRDITGATEKRAFRDLELLVERGSLKRLGSKRGRRYELP